MLWSAQARDGGCPVGARIAYDTLGVRGSELGCFPATESEFGAVSQAKEGGSAVSVTARDRSYCAARIGEAAHAAALREAAAGGL